MARFSLPATTGALLIAAAALFPQVPLSTEALLDRITARLESFNPKSSWTATVTSTQIENDRKWQPEKTTVLTKAIVVTEGHRRDNVVKVVETLDGKTADVTKQYLAKQKERREKNRARPVARPEPAPEKPNPERSRRRGLGLNDIADIQPFSADRRTDFSFAFRETTAADGRRIYLLDVRAKVKDQMNWDGTYTIDAATFTPIHGRLRPSETPAFVKELEVEADFEVFENVYFIPKRTWVKVNGGFLFIKRIRLISEEVYSRVVITH